MKYSILSLIFFYFSCVSAEVNFGVKLGYTSANQDFQYSIPDIDVDLDSDYHPGFNGGIFVEFPIMNHISLTSDLYFTQKGMQVELVGAVMADNPQGYYTKLFNYDNHLDHIGLSLASKFYQEISIFKPYLLAGIRYEWLIGKHIADDFRLVYDKYESNLFGFLFGLGTELENVISVPLLIEGVYHYDLTKVEINENLKLQNHVFEIKLGIKL